MASENFQAKDDFGQVQRVKVLTTATAVVTYTAKTGRAADDFIIDRVIRVNGTSGSAMAISLPNGVYYGQRCLVILEVYAATSTVDVTTTTGDNATQMTAAGGYSDLVWQGSTLGWVELSNETT
jgi:hypothetical protein